MADGFLDQLHRVAVQGVRLAVELDEAKLVWQYIVGSNGIAEYGRQGPAFLGEPGDAGRASQGRIGPVGEQVLQFAVGDSIKRLSGGRFQEGRHSAALALQALDETIRADGVDHLERTLDPVIAQLHRVIDGDQRFVDVRHEFRRVAKRIREDLPGVLSVLIVGIEQQGKVARRLGIDGNLRLVVVESAIAERLEVQRLLLRPLGFIETAFCALVADHPGFDHAFHDRDLGGDGVECVFRRQDVLEALRDVAHQVDADQVVEPEHAGLRDAHRPAEHGIRLLGPEPHAERNVQRGLYREYADAVAEEAGRVIANDVAFAHALVVEAVEAVDDLLLRALAADEFEQAHVTHGIEEVGDRELGAKRLGHVLDEQRDRDRRGVR